MVASIYIKTYFDHLADWYKQQKFEFDNYNDAKKELYYVPKNQSEHMVDFFVRYALSKSVKAQGEPFIFLGWNRTVVKPLQGTRNHHVRRTVNETGITKWFRDIQFDIATFIVTNKGNTAEDLEEIYETVIQPKSEYVVDMGPIFHWDYPEFAVNSQHSEAATSNPMIDTANLWALHFNTTITGPSIEFDEKQMGIAKSISASIYDLTHEILIDKIEKKN